jgi:hypothetical protein
MAWPPGLLLIAVPMVLIGLTAAGLSWYFGARRRRLHIRLICEAATRMSAALDEPWAPTARQWRDAVLVIVDQQVLADRIDHDIRPHVPVQITAGGETPELVAVVEDLTAIAEGLSPEQGLIVDPDPDLEPETGPIGPVPMLDERADFAGLYVAMATTAHTRVRQARAVLSQAVQLEAVDSDIARRLVDAVAKVSEADVNSRLLAAAGHYVRAADALTGFELPVSEEGVPGGATQRDLARQIDRLHQVAAAHRIDLLSWCSDALHRCGQRERIGGARL